MADMMIKKAFTTMVESMNKHERFHKKHREIYEGKRIAQTLGIALTGTMSTRVTVNMDWGTIAVNNLVDSLNFDAFKNDRLGFTRLLVESNALPALKSAMKSAVIGAVSFVAIIPTEDGLPMVVPYGGYEATGIWSPRTNVLEYALAVNERDNIGRALSYLLYAPGHIYKLDTNGEVLVDYVTGIEETLCVPFVHQQDMTSRPFGQPLIGSGAIESLDATARGLQLVQIGSEIAISSGTLLLMPGDEDDVTRLEAQSSMGRLNIFFNDTPDAIRDTMVERIVAPSTSDIQSLLGVYAEQFAASVRMPASLFGSQPANGSHSEGTGQQQLRPFRDMLNVCRYDFGESIKRVAILAMTLMTGSHSPDFEEIETVWLEPLDPSRLAEYGDGILKLRDALANEGGLDSYVIQRILGMPLRDEVLAVSYPNFKKSREAAKILESLKPATFGDGGTPNIPGGF